MFLLDFNKNRLSHTIFIGVVIIVAFLSGCRKNDFGIFSIEAQLTKNKWTIKSFTDYKTNKIYPINNVIYEFRKDGTYLISPENTDKQMFSTWELLDHKQYLKIGNNTFKLTYLSKRLLGLRYGNLQLFYVPVE